MSDRDFDAAYRAAHQEALDEKAMGCLRLIEAMRRAHDARIAELLAANNREVERRRAAEAVDQPCHADVLIEIANG